MAGKGIVWGEWETNPPLAPPLRKGGSDCKFHENVGALPAPPYERGAWGVNAVSPSLP